MNDIISEPREFIHTNLGQTTAPVVFCDARVLDDKLVTTLVSDQQLPGYKGEKVFTKELNMSQYKDNILDSVRFFGYYRNLNTDYCDEEMFCMDGAWPSVEVMQQALGVGSEYAFVSSKRFHTEIPSTEKAVVAHELAHNVVDIIGHKNLIQPVDDFVRSVLKEKMRNFCGIRNFYYSNRRFLHESVAFIAEYAYLKKNNPDLWKVQKMQLDEIGRTAKKVKSWHVIPYVVMAAEKEQDFFEMMRGLNGKQS